MAKKFPLHPAHPERICWGCDLYCPVGSLACGNGAERTMHPVETFGADWHLFGDSGLGVEPGARHVELIATTREGD